MSHTLLLLQPPIQDFYDTDIRLQPIGLCYLKAAIHRFLPGWQVVIKDYHHGWGRRTIPMPAELAYLKAYYPYPDKSPFSSFYHYYHFGASFHEIAQDVATYTPDIIGISSLFSPYCREVLRCAEQLKRHLDVPIILGGSHVSADPEGMLRHDCVDYVIRGEGERPLVELLTAWMKQTDFEHVPNLGWKRDGIPRLNPLEPNYAIDDIPSPDFSDFSPERYRFEQRPLSFLITSRGCPYHCTFCSVHLTFGRSYRKRAVDSILHEMQHRYHHGYRVFDFEDDNLTFDAEAMQQLCERIIAEFPQGDLELLAMNGLSYHDLTPGLLRLMTRAGFTHLNFSLVTADSATQRHLHRPHSLEQYRTLVSEGASLKLKMVSYQIIGLPGESLDSMLHTLVVNTELPVLLGASMFYLTPNAPIAQDFPSFTDADLLKSRSTAIAHETAHVRREEIFTLFVTARILNFLKSFTVPGDTMPLTDALDNAEHQGGRTASGVKIFHRLFTEQTLYALVGKEFKSIPRFQPPVFFELWSRLRHISTQEGKILTHLHFS